VLYGPKVKHCQIWCFGPACHDSIKFGLTSGKTLCKWTNVWQQCVISHVNPLDVSHDITFNIYNASDMPFGLN